MDLKPQMCDEQIFPRTGKEWKPGNGGQNLEFNIRRLIFVSISLPKSILDALRKQWRNQIWIIEFWIHQHHQGLGSGWSLILKKALWFPLSICAWGQMEYVLKFFLLCWLRATDYLPPPLVTSPVKIFLFFPFIYLFIVK